VGPVALVAGYLVAGEALLLGLGLVRTPVQGLRAVGAAVFVGWATTVLALTVGLLVGIDPRLRNAALVWIVLVAGGLGAALRPGRSEGAPRALREPSRPARAVAVAAQGVLAGYLALLLVRSWEPTGVLHVDVWNQWLPKAQILYFFGGLDTGPGGFTSQFNPDYPPLDATSEALIFDAVGGAEPLDLARVHWALAAAFLLAVAWLLAPRVRPAILWPSLLLLALAPRFGDLVGSSLADEPLAMLIGLAGLTGLIWLLEDDRRYAALCTLFLMCSTLTKNEGLMLSVVVVVALAAACPRRRHVPMLLAFVAAIVGIHALWRIWLERHSVPPNPFYRLTDALDPAFLVDRFDRLGYGLGQLLSELAMPSRWLLIVPATIVLAVLAMRREPVVSRFIVVVVVLDVLGFATVYWLSRVDLHFYVDNTVDRLPAFVAVLCGCVLPLLLDATAPVRLRPGARRTRL
jgi:hypothetical protein